jgi:ankyrin repeat protein
VDTINPAIPLDIAATHGCDSEIAALLIAKTRRPVDEFTGSQRLNPLQLCCAQPNPNMALLRQLLAAKADPTLRSRDGATPLMLAAGYGSIDSLKLLLKHNVPIDTQRDGSSTTALHWAVARGASEHVLALLKAGARVDIKSETGGCKHMTALLTAAVWGMWDIAETLIKHGTPASALEISGGTSVVHEAATNGEERILRLILDLPERPDLNTKNYNCLTPLELAAAKGNAACFKLLLDNGASLDAGTELNGGIAHASTSPVSNDIRKLLLRRDICWNVPSLMNSNNADFEDVLPLHRAASCGNNTCIQFLEKNGLIKDIDVQAEYGMTALHFATWSDQQETVKLLLQLGADPEKVETRYKQTPLISAARFNALKVIRPLLDHGCKTTTKDTYGLTAFMNAIQQNHTEMSKILQRHEDRVNGSLGWPDIPATPASGVSFAGQLLPTQSTQRRPKENHDMIQQLRDEILEFRQLLVKPELAPAADQPNTTVVQTSTITMTEIEQRQKVMTTTTKDNEVPSILEYQSYVVAAIVGGLAALLVWVVILLNRVNRAMMDIEMYIPRGR